ncbi:MAG TPA: hypothetical protein DD730_04610 [Desulfosporosinus sp.]|nr:hypothetical protein [Desulfosporosinus sp.]
MLRKGDIGCRIGGDEFVIILKKIDREECVLITERIILQTQPCILQKWKKYLSLFFFAFLS